MTKVQYSSGLEGMTTHDIFDQRVSNRFIAEEDIPYGVVVVEGTREGTVRIADKGDNSALGANGDGAILGVSLTRCEGQSVCPNAELKLPYSQPTKNYYKKGECVRIGDEVEVWVRVIEDVKRGDQATFFDEADAELKDDNTTKTLGCFGKSGIKIGQSAYQKDAKAGELTTVKLNIFQKV